MSTKYQNLNQDDDDTKTLMNNKSRRMFKYKYIPTQYQNVQVTKDNVHQIDFAKILETFDMKQPFFVGMEEIDFIHNEGEENKKFNWVDFSNRVIPFMTDSEAKRLVRKQMRDFEQSKILKSIRLESSPMLRAEKYDEAEIKRRPSERRGTIALFMPGKGNDQKFQLKVQKQQKLKQTPEESTRGSPERVKFAAQIKKQSSNLLMTQWNQEYMIHRKQQNLEKFNKFYEQTKQNNDFQHQRGNKQKNKQSTISFDHQDRSRDQFEIHEYIILQRKKSCWDVTLIKNVNNFASLSAQKGRISMSTKHVQVSTLKSDNNNQKSQQSQLSKLNGNNLLSPLLRIPIQNSNIDDIESKSSGFENDSQDSHDQNQQKPLEIVRKSKFNHRTLLKMPPARSFSILTSRQKSNENSSKASKQQLKSRDDTKPSLLNNNLRFMKHQSITTKNIKGRTKGEETFKTLATQVLDNDQTSNLLPSQLDGQISTQSKLLRTFTVSKKQFADWNNIDVLVSPAMLRNVSKEKKQDNPNQFSFSSRFKQLNTLSGEQRIRVLSFIEQQQTQHAKKVQVIPRSQCQIIVQTSKFRLIIQALNYKSIYKNYVNIYQPRFKSETIKQRIPEEQQYGIY
eukprot:403352546